jgi:hypothetical protein
LVLRLNLDVRMKGNATVGRIDGVGKVAHRYTQVLGPRVRKGEVGRCSLTLHLLLNLI